MTYVKSGLELHIKNLLVDIEIHTDNAVIKLDKGTHIDIKELKSTIEELLDIIEETKVKMMFLTIY